MVTKRTGRPRTGRPKKDGVVPFLQNPNRNLVMLLRAKMEVMRNPSIRAAAKVTAAYAFGNEVGLESLSPEGREIVANCRPGMLTSAFGSIGPVVHKADGSVSYKNTKRGANAATIEGAAEYIRKLDRQAHREAETNPDVARWLRCAVSGLILSTQEGAPAEVVAGTFCLSGDRELASSGIDIARAMIKSVT
jgi:hypothetical protein